jgi:hypothetical protein
VRGGLLSACFAHARTLQNGAERVIAFVTGGLEDASLAPQQMAFATPRLSIKTRILDGEHIIDLVVGTSRESFDDRRLR